MSQYTSSIINKYGDTEKVQQDIKIIRDIQSRQGNKFLIDCIAENAGETANKFRMNSKDRNNLLNSLLNDFHSAVSERV